jgi:aminoglycoside-2''-adenylyltransferase
VEWRRVEPHEAARLMRGYGRPWWIGGGWALDLFLGRETREHGDLDVVLFRADQKHAYAYFEGWDLRVAHKGTFTPWRGERLELPVHTVWARSSPEGLWELELFLMESDGSRWQFRRDPSITLELERLGLERDGVPYLAPEIALLYKAKEPRPHDEADFTAVVDELPVERRGWLASALRSQNATHPWLARLR